MAKKRRMKKAAKKSIKRKTVKGRAKPAGRVSAGAGEVFHGALQNLRGALDSLVAQRAHLDKQIAAIEDAIIAIGAPAPAVKSVGRPAGGPKGRRGGHRAGSLKEYLEGVLRAAGGDMAVKDITQAVVKSGYKSKNKTLAKSVGIALTQMRNVRKVGRGRFQLK